jgi:hypothetical protein
MQTEGRDVELIDQQTASLLTAFLTGWSMVADGSGRCVRDHAILSQRQHL